MVHGKGQEAHRAGNEGRTLYNGANCGMAETSGGTQPCNHPKDRRTKPHPPAGTYIKTGKTKGAHRIRIRQMITAVEDMIDTAVPQKENYGIF